MKINEEDVKIVEDIRTAENMTVEDTIMKGINIVGDTKNSFLEDLISWIKLFKEKCEICIAEKD